MRCFDDPETPCRVDLGSHGPRDIHDHPASVARDDYFDERAEAEYLRRSDIEWAHENPPEIGGEA